MKIHVKKFGLLDQADFEVGDLTIICGRNNTGKSYATYLVYDFLRVWDNLVELDISESDISKLLEEGSIKLDMKQYIDRNSELLKEACKEFKKMLPSLFSSKEDYFNDTEIVVIPSESEKDFLDCYKTSSKVIIGSAKNEILQILKESNSYDVLVSIMGEKDRMEYLPLPLLRDQIQNVIAKIVFKNIFRNPFIATVERTGVALFKDDLNIPLTRLSKQSDIRQASDLLKLFDAIYRSYAMPVTDNLDYAKRLFKEQDTESFIQKEHKEIIEAFLEISEGKYKVTQQGIYYKSKIPNSKWLTLIESSSSVRALMMLWFYLHHTAKPGDILLIDEPELSLHPENQRKMARLFARLVNVGMKVFVTTHSDYIIKELNTLIMFNQDRPHLSNLMNKKSYSKAELISTKQLRVYVAEKKRKIGYTLIPADLDPQLGIEARSFDDSINDMNRTQDEILFGEE